MHESAGGQPQKSDGGVLSVAYALTALVFIADLLLPLGVAGGVPYIVPVLVSLWARRKIHTVYVAAAGTALTVLGYYLSPEGGLFWMVVTNRFLAIGGVWLVAFLGLKIRKDADEITRLNRILENRVEKTRAVAAESEGKFKGILEAAPDGILGVDEDGRIVLVNSEAERLFGYTHDELAGQPVELLVPRRFRDSHPARRADYMASPSIRPMGSRLALLGLRKDGTEFPVEISLSPTESQTGLLVTAIVRDVTTRRAAELALLESEERFRQLADNLQDVIYLTSPDKTELLYVNSAVEKVFGLTPEEYTKTRGEIHRFVHPDDIPQIEEGWARQRRGDFDFDTQYRIFKQDGTIRWIRGRVFPIRDESGRVIRIGGILTDITEQMEAAEELRRFNQELEQLVKDRTHEVRRSETNLKEAQRVAHMGSFEWDVEPDAVTVSDQFLEIFGLKNQKDLVSAAQFFPLLHPDDLAKVETAVNDALAGKAPSDTEYRIIRPDGTTRVIHAQGEVTRNPEGQPVRMIGTVLDVTEKTELEEKLLEARKMETVGQLAGGIAHDFNNLMAVIGGYTELLLAEAPGRSAETGKLNEIKTAADRAASLTQKLLAYSRQMMMQPRVVNLNSIIREIGEDLCPVPREGYVVITRLEPRLDSALLDPKQIRQVVLGLTLNACEAMPGGGTLTVETANDYLSEEYVRRQPEVKPGRYVKLSILDTGVGMDTRTLRSIFEPFFTTKDKSTGAGMGLASIYGLVKQSGGFIEVKSKPDRGARFDVYFPSHRAEEAESAA